MKSTAVIILRRVDVYKRQVLVPFGKGSRARMGVVLACDAEPEHSKLKYLFDVAPALSLIHISNRLYEKLKVILQDRDIDDARVLTEAAIFGDKTAVDEETVRLRSRCV